MSQDIKLLFKWVIYMFKVVALAKQIKQSSN